MAARPTIPIPAVEDFRNEDEILVRFLDEVADEDGRRLFLTFWLDGNLEAGVRGQRHRGEFQPFVTRSESQGDKVRVIS